MASVFHQGPNSFTVVIYNGYNENGTQKKITKTYQYSNSKLSDKQKLKEEEIKIRELEEKYSDNLQTDNPKLTVKQFGERWMEEYVRADLEPKTIQQYEGTLRLYVYPALGALHMSALSPRHINTFYNQLKEDNVRNDNKYILKEKYRKKVHIDKAAGINEHNVNAARNGRNTTLEIAEKISSYLNISVDKAFVRENKKLSDGSIKIIKRNLSSMLTAAVAWGIIKDNPCARVKRLQGKRAKEKPEQAKVKHYDDEQILEVYLKLEKAPIKYQTAVYIASQSGLRLGEIAALGWDDIDFDNNTIIVNKQLQYTPEKGNHIKDNTKTESGVRIVDVPRIVIDKVLKLQEWQLTEKKNCGNLWIERNKLFTQTYGELINHDTLSRWWRKWLEANDLPPLPFHGLRHTYASQMIASGVDIITLAGMMGHKDPRNITYQYTHGLKTKKVEAAQKLNERLNSLLPVD